MEQSATVLLYAFLKRFPVLVLAGFQCFFHAEASSLNPSYPFHLPTAKSVPTMGIPPKALAKPILVPAFSFPIPAGSSVTDIDGNVYQTIIIGNQEWMKQNLNVTRYSNGDQIPYVTPETGWANLTSGAFGYVLNTPGNGRLYNGYAATDARGVCPTGWHVPTDQDWTALTVFLGGEEVAAGKLRAAVPTQQGPPMHWDWDRFGPGTILPEIVSTDESGFTAYPIGFLEEDGRYSWTGGGGGGGVWWTSTRYGSSPSQGRQSAYARVISAHTQGVGREMYPANTMLRGLAIRCVKNSASGTPVAIRLVSPFIREGAQQGTLVGKLEAMPASTGLTFSLVSGDGSEHNNLFTSQGDMLSFNGSDLSAVNSPVLSVRVMVTDGQGRSLQQKLSVKVIPLNKPFDRIGNTYNSVTIGNQEWMTENLRVTRYRNGDPIPEGRDDVAWSGLSTGAYVYPLQFATADEGKLYNWYAVSDSRGLCPSGWHMPSDSEWQALIDHLGGVGSVGSKLRTTGSRSGAWPSWQNWPESAAAATNESGFSAWPLGWHTAAGTYLWCNTGADCVSWWTSTPEGQSAAKGILLAKDNAINFIGAPDNDPRNGRAVRCLKNNLQLSKSSVNSMSSVGSLVTDLSVSDPLAGQIVFSLADGIAQNSFFRIEGNRLYLAAPIQSYKDSVMTIRVSITFPDGFIDKLTAELRVTSLSVTDIDGQVYPAVKIGNQLWMKKNLNVSRYSNGDPIPYVTSQQGWNALTTGAYGYVLNTPGNPRLYNGFAATDPRNVCPSGWRVPTDDDWTILTDFLGGEEQVAGKLRATVATQEGPSMHWEWRRLEPLSAGMVSTDESGFSAYPIGFLEEDGNYSWFGTGSSGGVWWSSTVYSSSPTQGRKSAYSRLISYHTQGVGREMYPANTMSRGHAIRCIQNSSETIPMAMTLEPGVIRSDAPTGTVAGRIRTNPLGSGVSYTLVSGSGSSDNELFTIDGDAVKSSVSLQGLAVGQSFQIRVRVSDLQGRTLEQPLEIRLTGSESLFDADGNNYQTVKIGNQEWMKENLRVSRYRNGDPIPEGRIDADWMTTQSGSFVYPLQFANTEEGKLYNWYTVADSRGLCPSGWHVPSKLDWDELVNQLGGPDQAGAKLRATGARINEWPAWLSWPESSLTATNESGFSAWPLGWHTFTGTYLWCYTGSDCASWWSSTPIGSATAKAVQLSKDNTFLEVTTPFDDKHNGYAVRCIRNQLKLSSATVPANAPTGTTVGKIIFDEQLPAGTVFSLISGDGAMHNALFRSDGDLILTAQSLTSYRNSVLTIRIAAQFPNGIREESIITISVLDNAMISDGLIGWWPLDGNGVDLSGNANNGVLYGPIAGSDRFAQAGKSMQFNGVSDFIRVPSSPSIATIEQQDAVTIAGWMKATNYPLGVFSILSKYNPATDWGWELIHHSGLGISTTLNESCTPVLSENEWHHVAFAYSRASGSYSIYLDGKPVCGGASQADIPDTGQGDLFFGYSPVGPDEWSHGLLDDVALWNRKLSEAEINYLYQGGAPVDILILQVTGGPNFTYGDGPIGLPVQSSSGKTLTYTSSNPEVVEVQQGTLIIKGVGQSTIMVNEEISGRTASQVLTVNRAALTAKADDQTRNYNTDNPALSISYSGFRNNETAAVLDTAPSAATTATKSSLPGTYPITLSGGADNNYVLTLQNGTLTITRLAQTISFTLPATMYQDQSPYTLSATSTSNGPIVFTVTEGPATISGNQLTITGSGAITVKATQAGTEIYNAAETTASTTVAQSYVVSGLITRPTNIPLGTGLVKLFYESGGLARNGAVTNGNYSISLVRPGRYILQVVPQGNEDAVAFPAYYNAALLNKDATVIDVQGNVTISMELPGKPNNDPKGPGEIKGKVISGNGGGRFIVGRIADGTGLANVPVYLLDATTNAVKKTAITDKDGFFTFTELLSGNYKLALDVVGASLGNTATSISITAENPVLEVSAQVAEVNGQPTVVFEVDVVTALRKNEVTLRTYPNPSEGDLKVRYNSDRTGSIRMTLVDMKGRALRTVSYEASSTGEYIFPSADLELSGGVYVLQLRQGDYAGSVKVVR